MHIQGTSQVHGAHGINAPHGVYRSQPAQNAAAGPTVDRVDISAAAEAASRAAETGGVRQDLVNTIRAQIAAGTYETPGKLDAALERMFDEMA
jgi:negative regulator of flagellin synthesis FlgM